MNNESLNFKYKLGKKYLVKNDRGGYRRCICCGFPASIGIVGDVRSQPVSMRELHWRRLSHGVCLMENLFIRGNTIPLSGAFSFHFTRLLGGMVLVVTILLVICSLSISILNFNQYKTNYDFTTKRSCA